MCIIGVSSHIISFALITSSAKCVFRCMPQVEHSSIVNGILNLECAVLPLGMSKAAIPLEATA